MASSKTHSTVVSYIKVWDNNTKGTITVATDDIVHALHTARGDLLSEALAEGVDGDLDLAEVILITKAEVLDEPLFPYVGHVANF